MAILAEALSVIIKHSSITTKYIGGRVDYLSSIPNGTYCTDGQIDRIGFMTPQDTGEYVSHLEQHGLISLLDEQFVDIAVVDMVMGPTRNCSWLGFARQKFFTGETQYEKSEEEFSIVWLLSENYIYGIPLDNNGEYNLVVPVNWTPDTAIYGDNFIPNDRIKQRLIELGNENGITKFWYSGDGKIVYVGRPKINSEDRTNRN